MAVVSSLPLHMGDPLKMKVLRSYREILIGGPRFEQLKGRKCSLRELSDLPWISLTSEAISRNFLNSYWPDIFTGSGTGHYGSDPSGSAP